jgi:hypothetical protein
MQKDVILIADYGRSGQGWLSYMLCYALNARYIEPYCLLRGLVFSGKEKIVAETGGNLPGRQKTRYELVVKTHNLPDPYFSLTDKVILLARDPRDVALSAYARYQVTSKTGTDVEIEAQKQTLTDPKKSRKSFFRKAVEWLKSRKYFCYAFTAYRWRKFYQAWEEVKVAEKVTYEELSSETGTCLKRLLRYLEVSVDEKLLNEAVGKFTFKSITGRDKGEEQKDNVAFRKGIAGDYKNKFSKFDRLIFKCICGGIMKKWGYE